MNPPRIPLRSLALMLLALLLPGCSSLLQSSAPPVQIYTLGAPPVEGASDPHPAVAASLRVAHPLAGPGLGTPQIVLLQPDHRMNVYAASAWAAATPALVESLTVRTLRASGAWRSIEDADSPFPSRYLLQISIRRFDADYSAGAGEPPTVEVRFDCTLGSEDGRKVLASFVAAGSAPAAANRLSDVIGAFQQASNQALISLARQALAGVRAVPQRRLRVGTPRGT